MYKTKLQELCQRERWELPVYTTRKNGPSHLPRFTATVSLQGRVFEKPEELKTMKEAQNAAAHMAFDHFNSKSANTQFQFQTGAPPPLPVAAPAGQPPLPYPSSPVPNPPPATLSMYKNQLQQYAQKKDIGFPEYSTEGQGPPHDRRFKARVSVNGITYETTEFFPTLKEAEQAVAKVACQALSMDVIHEDGRLYKNLLQEFVQKKALQRPSYETVCSGMPHKPVFVSVVAVGTNTFRGAKAKTKKQAEMNAAKVAYFDLTEVMV